MKKFLSSLVILAILVGMFVCLGVQGFAAEGDAAVYAVAGEQLTPDAVNKMDQEYPESLIVDVDGVTDDQSTLGLDAVYAPTEPTDSKDYAVIYPGYAQMFYVGTNSQLVVLVGVDAATAAETIANAASVYAGEPNVCIIAVGPADAGEAVMNSGAVQMFLTYGLEETAAAEKANNMGAVKLVNVGQNAETPVGLITVDGAGSASASMIPMPAAVTDPDIPVVDPNMLDPNMGVDPDATEAPVETPVPYSTITFNAGGAQGEMPQVTDFIGPNSYFFPNVDGYFAYEGYSFTGWTVDGGDGTLYQPGDDIWLESGQSISITANWQQIVQEVVSHTITFSAGDQGSGEMPVISVPEGESYTVPQNAFAANDGYEFDYWLINDFIQHPDDVITVDGDKLATAVWKTTATENEGDTDTASEPATYTVTLKIGLEGEGMPADVVSEPISMETPYSVPDVPEAFAAAAVNKTFAGWKMTNDPQADKVYQKEEVINGGADIELVAQWSNVQYTLTYKPGEGATGEDKTETYDAGTNLTTLKTPEELGFTAPSGKKFAQWTMAGYPVTTVDINGNVELVASWEDLTAIAPERVGADMLIWNHGGTDPLTLSFTNAAVASVTIDGQPVEAGSDKQYILSGDEKTITFNKTFLDGLTAKDNYQITVKFKADASGAPVSDAVVTLAVKVQETATFTPEPTATPISYNYTWAERSQSLAITFEKTPSGLAIDYTDEYKNANAGSDYSISGNTISLLPDLINKNWGGAWANHTYRFRVSFTDGTYQDIMVKLEGNIPETANINPVATPTATPVPAQSGGAPVTGDDTPIVLYIVILAVLIVALAVVLIIVMKRRNTGKR